MTPKEKAKELYNRCNPHCLVKNFYGNDVEVESTKQCALIAVDEIIRSHHNLYGLNNKEVKFYLEVQQEIEKL